MSLGRQCTVEFTSLGILTMLPSIVNWPPLCSLRMCIKGMCGDTSRSSNGVKFNNSRKTHFIGLRAAR